MSWLFWDLWGIAILFQMRGRNLWFASLGGLLAWGVYLGLGKGTSNIYLCAIGASFAMTVYSEIMARKKNAGYCLFSGLLHSSDTRRRAIQNHERCDAV